MRHGLGKVFAMFQVKPSTPEKMVERLKDELDEMEPILQRVLKGDWS